jgi:hypothetical protein
VAAEIFHPLLQEDSAQGKPRRSLSYLYLYLDHLLAKERTMLKIALALALVITTMGTTYALSHAMGGAAAPAVQQAAARDTSQGIVKGRGVSARQQSRQAAR